MLLGAPVSCGHGSFMEQSSLFLIVLNSKFYSFYRFLKIEL